MYLMLLKYSEHHMSRCCRKYVPMSISLRAVQEPIGFNRSEHVPTNLLRLQLQLLVDRPEASRATICPSKWGVFFGNEPPTRVDWFPI